MAGKPGCGRKGWRHELNMREILRMSFPVIRSLLLKKGCYAGDEFNAQRISVATQFCIKAMPTKIEGDGIEPTQYIIVRATEAEDKKA